MNRRGFFGAVGGGVLGASLIKLGWKPSRPVYIAGRNLDQEGERLTVTVLTEQGETYTWSITNPAPGVIMGPYMPISGVFTKIFAYHDSGRLTPKVRLYSLHESLSTGEQKEYHVTDVYHMAWDAEPLTIYVPFYSGDQLSLEIC